MADLEVARLFASLRLDSAHFRAGLRAAHGAIFNLKNALVGVGSGYGLKALASQFIAAARQAEDYRTTLRAVIKDQASADALFERVRTWAAINPINTDDAVAGFVRLKTSAIENAEAALETVADTATVMHRSVVDVASAVVTTEAEQLRQLGITLTRTGKAAVIQSGNVRLAVSNDIETVRRGILEVMSRQFSGAMQDAGDTFSGMMDTMGGMWIDFKQRLMGDGPGGPFGEVKQGIREIRDEWAKWMDSDNYRHVISSAQDAIVDMVRAITDEKDKFVAAVSATYAWVKENPNLSLGLAGFLLFGPAGGAITAGIGAYLDSVGESWESMAKAAARMVTENPALTTGGLVGLFLLGRLGGLGIPGVVASVVGGALAGLQVRAERELTKVGGKRLLDSQLASAKGALAQLEADRAASADPSVDYEELRGAVMNRIQEIEHARAALSLQESDALDAVRSEYGKARAAQFFTQREAREKEQAPGPSALDKIRDALDFGGDGVDLRQLLADTEALLAATKRVDDATGLVTEEYERAAQMVSTIRTRLQDLAAQRFDGLSDSLKSAVEAARGGYVDPQAALAMVGGNMQAVVDQARAAVDALVGIPEAMKDGMVKARIEDYLRGLGLEIKKTGEVAKNAFQIDPQPFMDGVREPGKKGSGYMRIGEKLMVSAEGKLLEGDAAKRMLPTIQKWLEEARKPPKLDSIATPGAELGAVMKTHQAATADNTAALRQLDESMRKRGEKPDGVTVTIGNVTVRDARDAERVGRSLGSGVMTPGY